LALRSRASDFFVFLLAAWLVMNLMSSRLAVFFVIGVAFLPCCAAEPSSNSNMTVVRDIEFADVDGVKLLLDLEMPADVDEPPLVMFIHGGGWTGGDRKSASLRWIVDEGYAVARIEYRMSHEAIFPAQIHDCKGALRWLRAHQKDYGYDANRTVVAGSSAGGHLVALMGTSGGVAELEGTTAGHVDQSSRVQGVIDYFGASNFVLRSKDQPSKTEQPAGSVYKLLGGAVSKNLELARLASPATHVDAEDPPLLIFHGENDQVVQPSQSTHLAEIYRKHGLEVKLNILPGKGHGWPAPSPGEREQVLQFLAKHLRAN